MRTYRILQSCEPAITPERFWHERAVEHQQRLIIIRLLASIDRKLERLVEGLR